MLLVLDYRELDQPGQIASSPPIHISFTGKMIASDLVRKWTKWNLALNCGAIIRRPGNISQVAFGAGNGQIPGQANGFGNIYVLDPAKLTDDDYGAMLPSYTTYFFVNHEMEQALQFGSHRKIYDYLAAQVIGTGNLIITPIVNDLDTAKASIRALALAPDSQDHDFERRIEVSGERCAFRFSVFPAVGTDVQFNLQKVVITMREHLMSPIAGPR
jgi:hypothetical protein